MGKPRSSFQQKVDWMIKNVRLWEGWPKARVSDDIIIKRMMADGLVSQKSNTYDILDFGKLVGAARSQLRKQPRHQLGDFL